MQTINLDLSVRSIIPLLHAKQGDVGRKFKAILTDGGAAYPVPAGAAVSVWYSGASGEGNYTEIGADSAVSVSGNEITVELITQMLANYGAGSVCIVINTADGDQLGTWNIPYMVEPLPGMGSAAAQAYFTAFSQAVQNLPYPDTTLSVAGRAADAGAVGTALAGKAPAGYVEGVTSTQNQTQFGWAYQGKFEQMPDNTVSFIRIYLNSQTAEVPVGEWLATITRIDSKNGFVRIDSQNGSMVNAITEGVWGTFTDCSPSAFAPTPVKIEKLISAPGWYKIGVLAGGFQYSGAITLYIGGQYYYSRPPVAIVDVVTTYNSAVVKARVQAGDLITQVTKVGLAAESSTAFGVYVYYGSGSANTVEIKIDASRGGFTPVVLEASDVTESNMTSVAYLDEYENPPIIPGVEYRTTKRYNGKPVYKMLVNMGTLPALGLTFVDTGITNSKRIIDSSINILASGDANYTRTRTQDNLDFHFTTELRGTIYSIGVEVTADYSAFTGEMLISYVDK